jgi:undecaprenyl-diphosphatase
VIERLARLDQAVFLALNGGVRSEILDRLMVGITDWSLWRIPVLLLLAFLFWKGGRRMRVTVALAVVAVVLADQITAFLKPLAGRTRPCFDLPDVRQLIAQSHSRSFPSAHAANSAAAAWVLGARWKRLRPAAAVVCLAVSYSRIHVGVHYPLDLAGGWIVGIASGSAALALPRLGRWIRTRVRRPRAGAGTTAS